jgi:tetratricopeptide (TPR) repeat protein
MKPIVGKNPGWYALLIALLLFCAWRSTTFVRAGASQDEAWETQIRALRLSESGHYAEAEPIFKQAVALEEARPRLSSWPYNLCLLRFVRNYIHQGRYIDALPILDKLYPRFTASDEARGTDTTDRIFIADCYNDAGEFLMLEHKYKEAEPVLAKALRVRQILERSDLANDRQDRYIDTAATESAIGRDLNAQKKFSEAQGYLDHAATLLRDDSDPTDWLHCELTDAQIKALTGQKKAVSLGLRKSAYSFYRQTDFDKPGAWSVYLKSSERTIYSKRKSVDCWWHYKDTATLFEKALNEAAKFGKNDMRLAGTLLRFGTYDMMHNKETEGLPLMDQAIAIAGDAGQGQLAVTVDYLNNSRASIKYPSFGRREDLELISNEIAAYKKLEGAKSKHAASLCREYVQIVSSQRGLADRWKVEQYKPMLNDIEMYLGIFDPLTLQVLSSCVKELKYSNQYYDAMVLQRKVVAGTKECYGPRSHETGLALEEYAHLLYETNDAENAKSATREAEAILGPIAELDAMAHMHDNPPSGVYGFPR